MKRICIFLALFFVSTSAAFAQERPRVYSVPLKYFSFWLLNKDDCPLKLSDPKVYAELDGTLHYSFTISNTTNKSIKSFRIEAFDAFQNPSYGSTPNLKPTDEFAFVPYDVFKLIDENLLDVVPWDPTMATKFKLSEDRKRFRISIVTKVEVYKGKAYDATPTYKRIEKFISTTEDRSYDWENEKVLLTFDEKSEILRKFLVDKIQKNSDFLIVP